MTKPQVQHIVQVDVGQQRREHAPYNVAKLPVEFTATISRAELRPRYGEGFRGAPLRAREVEPTVTVEEGGAEQKERRGQKVPGGDREL
jgi:hypothetical protein